MLYGFFFASLVGLVLSGIPYEHENGDFTTDAMTEVMRLITEERVKCRFRNECPIERESIVGAAVNCVNGMADEYPCSNVNLLAFVSLADLGASGAAGNDIWGWRSPNSGAYYALVGTTVGTSFVDISDPVNPNVIGFLDSNVNFQVSWRDIKIYNGYAYIVADDRNNAHGMQVVNLNDLDNGHVTLVTTYRDFGSCHNIVIDEATGFAYGVGSRTCSGGLHQVDITNPANPLFAGCFSSDGYTHDAECIIYSGPDSQYSGKEICMNYNEDTLTLVDVSDHSNPIEVSRTPYPLSAYTHQGWLTADGSHIFLNDELDESRNGFNTRTHLWDVSSLSSPIYKGYFSSLYSVIDHNLYITSYNNREMVFMSNYETGLLIYEPNSDLTSVNEVGHFDTFPSRDSISFNGQWSNYPFWVNDNINGYSGVVIAQDINRGFFVLQYNEAGTDNVPTIPLTTV